MDSRKLKPFSQLTKSFGSLFAHRPIALLDETIIEAVLEYDKPEHERTLRDWSSNSFPRQYNFIVDVHGHTLLHLAAMSGKHELIQLLVKQEFDVNALSDHDHTPLVIAIKKYFFTNSDNIELRENLKKTIKALVNAGAKNIPSGIRGSLCTSAMREAASTLCIELVEILVQGGLDINECDEISSPLRHLTMLAQLKASRADCHAMIAFLEANGARDLITSQRQVTRYY